MHIPAPAFAGAGSGGNPVVFQLNETPASAGVFGVGCMEIKRHDYNFRIPCALCLTIVALFLVSPEAARAATETAKPAIAAVPATAIPPSPPAVEEQAPATVVKRFYDILKGTMKEGPSLGFQGRYRRLQSSVEQSFDLDAMMRMAAGPAWPQVPAAQQKGLLRAFRAFSISTYASRFPRYAGERFQVLGERPGPAADEKIVETQLVSGGDKTGLHYRMRKSRDGGWKIVDVYVNGTISEMAARRSEFGSVLRQQGPEALLRLLRQKSDQLARS